MIWMKLKTVRFSPAFTLSVTLVAYLILYASFYRSVGVSVGAFAVLPVIVAAWFWGIRWGLMSALLGFPVNTVLSSVLTLSDGTLNFAIQVSTIPGTLALVFIGVVVGKLSDLQKQVRFVVEKQLETQEQLDKSLQLFEGIFHAAMDAIIAIDSNLRIVLFNPAAEILFGRTAREAIGQPLNQFFSERFRSVHDEHIRKFAEFGITRRSMAWPEVATGLRADGTEFLAEATISRFERRGEKLLAVSMRDVTEREKALTALRESEERFLAFMSNTSAETWMKDEQFRYVYASAPFERLLGLKKESILGKSDFDLWPSETAKKLRTNDEEVLSKNRMLEMVETVPNVMGEIRYSRVFKFPFVDSVGRRYVGGMALDITNLMEHEREVLIAHDAAVEGWAYALDLRDNEVRGHAQRVAYMTVHLAKSIGIEGVDIDNVRRGALLHDIGKIGIPDHILFKPGRLTDEEWLIMRKHPQYAFEMLNQIKFLRPALDIPYCHHEKWDGTGYPRGLKGELIPLPARIFAVVDVWDALRSDRPYRKAWPEDKTLQHIRGASGTHFDPQVVNVFLLKIEKLKKGTASLKAVE